MRVYPRMVYLDRLNYRIVKNEQEEIQAASEGYESHHNPVIVAKRKGTDREILRGKVKPQINQESKDFAYYTALKWPTLKKEAKKLESVYNTDIVTRTTKREDILEKIGSLLNGDNG